MFQNVHNWYIQDLRWLQNVLSQKFVEVQMDKIDLNSVYKSSNRGGKWKWVGWWHYLNLVPSAIQLACVNSPVFRVANNIAKLVFWRNVSYSPKLTCLWKKKTI